jgi:hypothetical protein
LYQRDEQFFIDPTRHKIPNSKAPLFLFSTRACILLFPCAFFSLDAAAYRDEIQNLHNISNKLFNSTAAAGGDAITHSLSLSPDIKAKNVLSGFILTSAAAAAAQSECAPNDSFYYSVKSMKRW